MTYPKGLLDTRARIRPKEYALIPPDGLVRNVIPHFKKCDISILASPKLGANFVQYVGIVHPGGCTSQSFLTEPDIEGFLYILQGEGQLTVLIDNHSRDIGKGGYAYIPANASLNFVNENDTPVQFLLYKQRYIPLEGYQAETVFGDIDFVDERLYNGMVNVYIKDLLPRHLGFDMNIHSLSFEPAGCHSFVETNVQEHGIFVLAGEGVYLLGNEWVPIQKNDFIYMGAFTPQAVYATGRKRFTYIFSRKCNRDISL